MELRRRFSRIWDLSFDTFSFITAFTGKQKRQQLIQFLEAEIKVWDLLIFFFLTLPSHSCFQLFMFGVKRREDRFD